MTAPDKAEELKAEGNAAFKGRHQSLLEHHLCCRSRRRRV